MEKYQIHILKGIEKLEIYNNENELRLLWECCQIPDFVKKTYGNHLEVVGRVFNFLREKSGRISNTYMKEQLSSFMSCNLIYSSEISPFLLVKNLNTFLITSKWFPYVFFTKSGI